MDGSCLDWDLTAKFLEDGTPASRGGSTSEALLFFVEATYRSCMPETYIHPTAIVDPAAEIGEGSKVWVNVQIREGARIGRECILSKDVYVDRDVVIGDRCKIQNSVSIYSGVTIGDEVFIGPNACFTNDRVPRAVNPDWTITPTVVQRGSSIGANATIICGITIGEFAMIGAGSVVTRTVEPFTLAVGNPARAVARINRMGERVEEGS